jgi:serine/threonine protein kinase/WD40 repeat protein
MAAPGDLLRISVETRLTGLRGVLDIFLAGMTRGRRTAYWNERGVTSRGVKMNRITGGRDEDDVAKSIFLDAVEIASKPERLAYLDRRCGSDHNLRSEVETLLRHQRQLGDYLERPAIDLEETWHLTPRAITEGPGTVIGPYKLVQELGAGGMGEVWMAEQTHPVRRKVALKIIKAGMDTRQIVARFEAEHQALALMDHPNIAKVFDAGATECGRPYFVMELVQGVPITTYCDDYHLTPRERLGLFLSVCQAVQHAHQKGIIHRDLKPSNVLVTFRDDEPLPKVIDFGVAKATGERLTERTAVTQCGQLVGTLEYMSPEQASFALDIDTRSDIYSLGVLLYELLTGSTPFEKKRLRAATFDEGLRIIREEEPPRASTRLSTIEGLSTITAHCNTEPADLRRLLKGDLDWILMRCLEKDRNRRYETANGLAMDLKRYLADEPVAACPPSVRYRLRKAVRRHKGPVVAASLVVLALVGGIIGTTWGLIRANDQLFFALLHRARAGRLSRQMGQRLDSLEALARAARIRPDELLRDEAIAAMALPDVRLVPGWHSAPPDILSVAYGWQYRLYACADRPGIIIIRSIPDNQEMQRIASGTVLGKCMCFSPDDRFLLAIEEGYRLRVWRVADGQPVLPDDLRDCRAYAFSPDGRRLAIGQREWVLLFDLATGQEVRRCRLPARVHGLAFHPDNGKLAVGYFKSSVASVYDAASWVLLTHLAVGPMDEQFVFWHPDGERLAVTGTDPRIQIWNVATKRRVATLEGHTDYVSAVTFHPEGGLLASHSWDGVLRLWDPATGRQLLQLPLNVADRPRFSSDGRLLGAAPHGEQTDLLEVTPSCEYLTLVSSEGAARGVYSRGDISPDGRLLVVGMDEGARLWDLQSRRELTTLPAGTVDVSFAERRPGEGGAGAPNGPHLDLLTCGSSGLLRWPITSDPQGRRLCFGPPRQLSALHRACFARGPDGSTLAAVTEEGGANKILDLETGAVQQELGVHPQGDVRALSGDGRWTASCGWHSDRVRVWNIRTGQIGREWVLGRHTLVFFTPGSRALIIARGDEFSFWDVKTWQPTRRLRRDIAQYPGWVAFSPDGRLMAMEMAPAVIHLKEVATGRTVAKFEDPHGDRACWQGFTPDGTRLVIVSRFASAVHIWDLRAIRKRLKDMNLDWDWPEFPPAATGDRAAEPLTIKVLPDTVAKTAPTPEQRARRAIERFRREVEANPDSAESCNKLAWVYLSAPEALRDVRDALPLAEEAVRLAAGNAAYRKTLGVAYYRAGRYREAVEVLRPNLESQRDEALALDLYFLAMSLHRLGETARARDYYDWAVRWAKVQQGPDAVPNEELATFRSEAEELLGIDRR